MEQLSLIEKLCAFCCGIMAEMGNFLEMSYQKVNVILFCWLEPGIFIGLFLTFLWVCLHLPWRHEIALVSLVIYSLFILAIVVLLFIATVMLVKQFHADLENPVTILNMNESNPLFVYQFNDTVKLLTDVSGSLRLSYAAINLLLYVLLLPIGIILCYLGIIKNLVHKP